MEEAKTNKEKAFVERNREHLQKVSQDLITKVLTKMLEHDTTVYDMYYIEKRVYKILQDLFENEKFTSEDIRKLRKDMFKRMVKKAKSKKIKKQEVKDELEKERNDRCEQTCQDIIKELLDVDLLMSSMDYFDEAIDQDDQILLKNRINDFVDATFEGVLMSLNESLRRGGEKVWGCSKEEIKMKQLDKLLK